MNPDIMLLFGAYPGALPLYLALERRILDAFPNARLKVGKTQVSFSERYGFAYASPPIRRAKDWPKLFVLLTFGLGYRKEHPRFVQTVEPYPGRWTYHVLVEREADIDDELMAWVRESHDFSMVK